MVEIRNPLTIIQSGSPEPTQPLDPKEVYKNTRPSDWLVMPEIGDNEDNVLYFLLSASSDLAENVAFQLGVDQGSSSATATFEFGTTDSSGNFTPISSLTQNVSGTSAYYPDRVLPSSAFVHPTSDGCKQVICKITTSGYFTRVRVGVASNAAPVLRTKQLIVEFKGKATQCLSFDDIAYGYNYDEGSLRLRYYNLVGSSAATSMSFRNAISLIAVLNLDTSNVTSFANMFYGCGSLLAIPALNTSRGTSFNSMFRGCSSLVSVPQIDVSSATNMGSMFYDCYSLGYVPPLNSASCTIFSYMFSYCFSLGRQPVIDTSAGTDLRGMFSNCKSLFPLDLRGYDFSSATASNAMAGMCNNAWGRFILKFGSTWSADGITTTTSIMSISSTGSGYCHVIIDKTDAMLPATNPKSAFNNSYILVYVPDDLLATYQADANWSALGDRLKGFSDLPS